MGTGVVMATPTPITYYSQVQKFGGGRQVFPNLTLDKIASVADGEWVKLNTNLFQDCWAPGGLRTALAPSGMFRAWSGFGWDRNRHGFWFWGGGHANYTGNEVYFWSAVDGQWTRAFLGSRWRTFDSVTYPGSLTYSDIDDTQNTPTSAHTYSNNIYLPILDRFLTFGGATQGDAIANSIIQGNVVLREAGCYTLQPGLWGQDFVGSRSGHNMQGTGYETAQLPGARAWQVRDWYLDNQSAIDAAVGSTRGHVNTGAVWREENGHDVVYFLMGSSFARSLFRAEFVDHDYRNDIVTRVSSSALDESNVEGAIGLDIVRNLVFEVTRTNRPNRGQFVDLKRTWGTTNQWQKISAFAGDPAVVTEFLADCTRENGCDYDPVRDQFVLWQRGRPVWGVKAPEGNPTPTTGWVVTKLSVDTGAAPDPTWDNNQSGTHGKWEWAPDLRCFIGATHTVQGNVWAWRPHGWTDPRSF